MAAPSLSLAKANSVFSLALLKTLGEKDKMANIIYSPLSISSAMSMVLLGARGNTAEEISRVLGFSEGDQSEVPAEQQRQPIQIGQQQMQMRISSQDHLLMQMQQASQLPDHLRQLLSPSGQSGASTADSPSDEVHAKFGELLSELNKADAPYALNVANKLYGEQTFQFVKEFLADLEKYYGAGLESVDFKNNAEGARVMINTWVEDRTQGKIKDLLAEDTLSNLTKLALVNAIYFKAKWEKPFKSHDTIDFDFRLNKNDTKPVKMMCQENVFPYRDIPEFKLKVLEMPYQSEELSMIFLLPEDIEDDTTGLERLERELTHQNFVDWTRPDRMTIGMLKVKIPKFKLSETYDLNGILKKMGMSGAFSSESDFSGMSPVKDLALTKVVHKAYVAVDEEGTEAAAATGAVFGVTSANVQLPTYTADHPFLIAIKHKRTKSVIFAGRVSSPE